MRALSTFSLLAVAALFGATHPSFAASFSVAPVSVSVPAPGRIATLTLRNNGDQVAVVQIRPFSWSQASGADELNPTRTVVASPPMAKVAPGAEQTVRIVRTTEQPVDGEESYRLLIDELPNPASRKAGTVSVLLRYSIPVFFTDGDAASAKVNWTVSSWNPLTVHARNSGQRHLRISDIRLQQGETAIPVKDGLVGYVLAGSSMQWSFPQQVSALPARAKLVGVSQNGPFDAALQGEAGR